MKINRGQIELSASDLAKYLACPYLTSLDLKAARGEIERVYRNDPSLAVLQERGSRHEAAYLERLKQCDLEVLYRDDSAECSGTERTVAAMKSGTDAIVQAELHHEGWRGRADVLLRVNAPSALGEWSYEVVDTKLARETRAGTILQLCLYSELVGDIQGRMPDHAHVVVPGNDFQPETFRLAEYLAYYRYVKSQLERFVTENGDQVTYPEPVEQCDICDWWSACDKVRRVDDHLSFVAGITKLQIRQLSEWKISTLAGLAAMPIPLVTRPKRGAPESYVKAREQARLQLEYRTTAKPVYELLPVEPRLGLNRLPEASPGDIFLDFESDPFVEDGGLEYLLGYLTLNDDNQPQYTRAWAFDRANERRIFESFVDTVMDRRKRFPDLHICHFSPYEPVALKRLMGRFATREDEMDQLLRAGVFVDLYGITKQTLRASVERYSLKDLEMFFGFKRDTDLQDATRSLRLLECALELNSVLGISPDIFTTIEAYNREDCVSALRLRDWLEKIRQELVQRGEQISRPVLEPGAPSEAVDQRRKRILSLMNRLLDGIPDDPGQHNSAQQGQWLLAYMLEWHRREEKAPWWEYFRLRELSDEERLYDRSAISGLEFVKRAGGTKKCPIDRYRFPEQDMQIREEDMLHTSDAELGEVVAINNSARTIDVKKHSAMAEIHPTSAFVHNRVGSLELVESLFRLGTWVADHGIDAPGAYRAARDLLMRSKPRLIAAAPSLLYRTSADVVDEAKRLALQLDCGVLPIQGPPGAGKTFTAARMMTGLLQQGKKIGITAVSHKVIRKLLEETLDAAGKENRVFHCIEKVVEKSKKPNPAIPETKDNPSVLAALQSGGAQLAAGTAWLWARPEFAESVDVLFVDEAGQMSLADVLAVSQAARSIVLLGDPQQLEQPLQGTHPPGVAVSALQHVLGTAETMPVDMGLFLSETWRMAPSICRFTSELFYENRLKPHAGLELQKLTGPTRFAGAGLWLVPVAHEGNQVSSDEEADAIEEIVRDLLQTGVSWMTMKNETRALTSEDILIVSPYNAQVFKLAGRLPNFRIGTVDKFQGQEAPVVIYSMATSSPEEASRGMEFLYSLNRFNVASSRARCACILVGNPLLFGPACKSPRQMKLANVLCRYREMAQLTR